MSMDTKIMSDSSRLSLQTLLTKHNMHENITQEFWNDFELWLFSYLKQFVKNSLTGVLDNILKKLDFNRKSTKFDTDTIANDADEKPRLIN